MKTRKVFAALGLASIIAVSLTACGVDATAEETPGQADVSSNQIEGIPEIMTVQELADQVPATVRDKGFIVATSADTPPMTYFDEDDTTMIGFDVDMSRAIGSVLGVSTDIRDVGFDTIIPGLASERFTAALASMGPTPERQKTVDFVSYYNGGQGFLALKTSGLKVNDLEGLCGLRVAVGVGTVQQTALEDSGSICQDAGLEPFEILPYPDLNQSVLAISSDRADILYASISIIGYTAGQDNKFEVAGVYKRAIVGAALPKDSEMTPLVQAAVQHLIDDGTYEAILEKWGLEGNGVETAEINPATI